MGIEVFKKIIEKDVLDYIESINLDIGGSKLEWTIMMPPKLDFGDFALNLPFVLAKYLKQSPLKIGTSIIRKFKNTMHYKDVVFHKPGYINIYLKDEDVIKQLKFDLKKDIVPTKKKYYIEYISANPTGILHLGHLRIGLASRIYGLLVEFLGGEVYREYIVNDGGMQITTLLNSAKSLIDSNFNNKHVTYYSKELDDYCKKVIKEKTQVNAKSIVSFFINEIQKDIELMKIDSKRILYISENDFASKEITTSFYNSLIKQKICYLKDNAIFIATTQIGDSEDRVVVKSNGNRTYVGTDILYHLHKFKKKYDVYINFWGFDHQGNESTLRYSLKLLKAKDVEKLKIVFLQFVKIKKNNIVTKMSKRLGTNVSVRSLKEVIDIDNVSHYMMSKSFKTILVLDLNELRSETKYNTLYYLQYTFARITQLLKKGELWLSQNPLKKNNSINKKVSVSLREKRLVLLALKCKDVLFEVEKTYELNKLYAYLYDYCELFHIYYQNEKILTPSNSYQQIEVKLNIVKLVRRILIDLFTILSIDQKNEMKKLEN